MVGSITKIQYALNGHLEARFSQQYGSLSKEFGFGVSFYVTVWSLLERPLKDFSVGLPSTWIKPENDDVTVLLCPIGTYARDHWKNQEASFFRDYFQTIEGGAGFWANTQLPTKAPKYRILGIPKCYTTGTGMGAPGWPFGFDFDPNEPNKPNAMPDQAMGLAQLSNCILVPPDGMPFAKGSEAKQLGVAWMALPLMDYAGYFHLQSKVETDKCLEWRGAGQRWDKVVSARLKSSILDPAQLWGLVPTSRDGLFHLQNLKKNGIVRFESDFGLPASDLYKYPSGEDCYRIYAATGPAPYSLRLGNDGSAKITPAVEDDREQWRLLPQAVVSAVATGDSSWTLFFSSENFNGPVAFFPPETWSRISKENLPAVGRGLDARPARMDRGAMEFAMVPGLKAEFGGEIYLRIPKLLFPTEPYKGPTPEYKGKLVTPFLQDVTLYSRQAIYKAVMSWFSNVGRPASGKFAETGAKKNIFNNAAPIAFASEAFDGKTIEGIFDLVEVIALGDSNNSFGLLWKSQAGAKGQFPEYFRMRKGDADEPTAPRVIAASDVPEETGLAAEDFDLPNCVRSYHPYISPQSGAWTSPGPTGKPQTVTLEDKTIVTYAWYKFIDQPALQNLNLTEDQKRQLQSRIELLHQNWFPTGEYMKPPSTGSKSLVSMDPNLIIPPLDRKIGYVPIVIGQVSPKQEECA